MFALYYLPGVPKQGGTDGGYISPQYFGFLQILGRKFRLKAKKPLKLTKMVNHPPPQCWTQISTAVIYTIIDARYIGSEIETVKTAICGP